jgi:hypothetical protein
VSAQYDTLAANKEGEFVTFEHALVWHRMIKAIYKSDKNGTRESDI